MKGWKEYPQEEWLRTLQLVCFGEKEAEWQPPYSLQLTLRRVSREGSANLFSLVFRDTREWFKAVPEKVQSGH